MANNVLLNTNHLLSCLLLPDAHRYNTYGIIIIRLCYKYILVTFNSKLELQTFYKKNPKSTCAIAGRCIKTYIKNHSDDFVLNSKELLMVK